MVKISIFVIAFLVLFTIKSFAQGNKVSQDLIKVWAIEEYIENGNKFSKEDMDEIVVDFKEDKTYIYREENQTFKGKWELTDDETKILFDKGSADEEVWEIISFDVSKLVVKFSIDKTKYKFTFLPKIKKTE